MMNVLKSVMKFSLIVQRTRLDFRCMSSPLFYIIFQAIWIIKCKALTKQNYIDDIEMDEESVAEMIMDENALASMPRYEISICINYIQF